MKRFWIILIVFHYQCSNHVDSGRAANQREVPDGLLIFVAEQRAEVWFDNEKESLALLAEVELPIGIYEWSGTQLFNAVDTIVLTSFLEVINMDSSANVAFVFPNDARRTGQFQPCFRCPHSITALYSRLWLHLQDYDVDGSL